jgi:hypothetical protein
MGQAREVALIEVAVIHVCVRCPHAAVGVVELHLDVDIIDAVVLVEDLLGDAERTSEADAVGLGVESSVSIPSSAGKPPAAEAPIVTAIVVVDDGVSETARPLTGIDVVDEPVSVVFAHREPFEAHGPIRRIGWILVDVQVRPR